jgi:hypothetical protein
LEEWRQGGGGGGRGKKGRMARRRAREGARRAGAVEQGGMVMSFGGLKGEGKIGKVSAWVRDGRFVVRPSHYYCVSN